MIVLFPDEVIAYKKLLRENKWLVSGFNKNLFYFETDHGRIMYHYLRYIVGESIGLPSRTFDPKSLRNHAPERRWGVKDSYMPNDIGTFIDDYSAVKELQSMGLIANGKITPKGERVKMVYENVVYGNKIKLDKFTIFNKLGKATLLIPLIAIYLLSFFMHDKK